MKRICKKKIVIFILVIIPIDLIIGGLLFKNRAFSHLAIWEIIESDKKEDFYWAPEEAPAYFRFEPNGNKLSVFRDEISPLLKDEKEEFRVMLNIAKYVMDISSGRGEPGFALKWDSPQGMLRQIKEGAMANCFHRSILFSTLLSALGFKARLWALEGDNFNALAHSITEVYIKDFKKWVFLDVTWGFYVTQDEVPLSLLELRERLLNNKDTISIKGIGKEKSQMPDFYVRFMKCVFLRSGNNYAGKYATRYGFLSIIARYIDGLPEGLRRGITYLIGRQDIFIHYVDGFSGYLKPRIIMARLLFYFFVFSLLFIGVLSIKGTFLR